MTMKTGRTKTAIRQGFKAMERRVAQALGGKRVPVTGRERGDAPDVEHELFSIECKQGARGLPAWFTEGYKQAIAAWRPGQLPIVIYHTVGTRHEDAVVCIRVKHLRQLMERLGYQFPKEEDDAGPEDHSL